MTSPLENAFRLAARSTRLLAHVECGSPTSNYKVVDKVASAAAAEVQCPRDGHFDFATGARYACTSTGPHSRAWNLPRATRSNSRDP